MDKNVRAMVIAGNGINCERETAQACLLAGAATADIVHLSQLLEGTVRLDEYHFLNFPGGFLDGDDLGSAKAGVNRLRHAPVAGSGERVSDQLRRFIAEGKLIMGVCNGFQLLVKLGLLPAPGGEYAEQVATLTFNNSGRFEDRWVHLAVDPDSPCISTRGLESLYLPVRHGEGRFVARDGAVLAAVEAGGLAPLRYSGPDGRAATMDYPANPNGSQAAVAGLCDPSGRIFGLMPHPEAYVHRTHHPRWTREPGLPEEGMGLWLYRNAIRFLRDEVL